MITNAIPATVTTHDEFVAYFNANISDFAKSHIRDSILEGAAAGDYYDREYVASESHYFAKLEAMTDAEIRAAIVENKAAHARAIELDDPSEYDVNDHESYYQEQYYLEDLLAHRAAVAQYTNQGPLTHNPFAALAGAA